MAAALADYETALELDDTLIEAWLGLADVYIRQGGIEKAIEVLRQALDKIGEDSQIIAILEELERNMEGLGLPVKAVMKEARTIIIPHFAIL